MNYCVMTCYRLLLAVFLTALVACSNTSITSDVPVSASDGPVIEDASDSHPHQPAPMLKPPLSDTKVSKRQNPAVAELLNQAGRARDLGDFDRAVIHLERALRIDPYSAAAYYQLASIRLQQHEVNSALQLAQKGLQLDADESGVMARLWELLALCYEAAGNSKAAHNARVRARQLY